MIQIDFYPLDALPANERMGSKTCPWIFGGIDGQNCPIMPGEDGNILIAFFGGAEIQHIS
jgi:hypothetical protein